MNKQLLDKIALVLALIGAINWGLVGLFNINLVTLIFGTIPMLVTLVYALVGLSGLYLIYYMYNM
jgi:uncharacterized membrane protein YuzA (DUF378 family)